MAFSIFDSLLFLLASAIDVLTVGYYKQLDIPYRLTGVRKMNTVNVYLAIIIILVIALLFSFRLSAMLATRAVCRVVAIFRDNQAIDYQKALPLETLGLGPRPLLSFRLLRDYKLGLFRP
jgi:hypothetical protein